MKFLIVDTDYPDFVQGLYAQHPDLEKAPYAEQLQARMESLFGLCDFYSSNLRKLGHEAFDVICNAEHMQRAWAREHDISLAQPADASQRVRGALRPLRDLVSRAAPGFLQPILRVPWRLLDDRDSWIWDILAAQINSFRPDVLVNLAMDSTPASFLRRVKGSVRVLIGSASPPVLLKRQDWSVYDLALGRSEFMVDVLRKNGLRAELLRGGFEPRVLSALRPGGAESTPVSFVGSLGRIHSARVELLQSMCDALGSRMSVWAPSVDQLPPDSSIRKRYQGPAYGRDSFQVLADSKITLNNHLDIAGNCADNLRLFEATGVGTLLLTDWKTNLPSIFELGKDVVTYRTPEECADYALYYLEHPDERHAIARAGQERTLRDHTYFRRMQELVEVVDNYL